MRARFFACLGSFAVMALSNAIVPLLPSYTSSSSLQGAIYGAYFLGAFLLTLPAGLLSDRHGRLTVMRWGLIVSLLSGVLLILFTDPFLTTGCRLLEGFGAGLFVAASMAYVNSLPDHGQMSGYLMASLNAGLVIGLVASGGLAVAFPAFPAGLYLFTGICTGALLLGHSLQDTSRDLRAKEGEEETGTLIRNLLGEYRWLWYSTIILTGVTGVITSLYPEFSDVAPDAAGAWISVMSIATIVAVLAVAKLSLPPVPTIQAAALLMAAGVLLTYFSPAGFILVGAMAGIVMIAQMAFLATVTGSQGAAMGLFSTTGYLGMSLLPVAAGIIAEHTGFFPAFGAAAFAAVTAGLTIGRCSCRYPVR